MRERETKDLAKSVSFDLYIQAVKCPNKLAKHLSSMFISHNNQFKEMFV